MIIGEKVKVYQKPLTREDFEGEATVCRIFSWHPEYKGKMYCAMVNFPEDGPNTLVERRIAEGEVLA
jgi:hypothetical protein